MFSGFFRYRGAKVLLAGILLIVLTITIVTTVGTYFLIRREQEAKTVKNTKTTETMGAENYEIEKSAFFEIKENLKRQARHALTVQSFGEERHNALATVGELLKEILRNQYTATLDNNAFRSDGLYVTIDEYPLDDDRSIKRIQYSIRDEESYAHYMDSRYFLQFCGETSFFSDIEFSEDDEQDFKVFENIDGCFAFLVYSKPEYNVFSSITDYPICAIKVFIPDDTGFSVEDIEIPVKVDSYNSFQLVQQEGMIKGIVKNKYYRQPAGAPEYLFNSVDFTFNLVSGFLESEPVDYDFPGLLLGVSDSHGNIRSFFIRRDESRIRVDEYSDRIVFPRQDGLYVLKHYTHYEENHTDELGHETEHSTGSVRIRKLICSPLGEEPAFDFGISYYDLRWHFCDSNDIPLFVGEDCISYIQKSFYTGGGSYSASSTNIRFDKLDDLSKFSFKYHMAPGFNEITLADFIYGEKAVILQQPNVRTYGGQPNPYIDFKHLSIMRNLGKWSLMLPVMEEYDHPGNGSFSNWIQDFAVFSNDVPTSLVKSNEAFEYPGVWSYWDAKDLVQFPDSDALLAQYDYVIGIGNRETCEGFGDALDMCIPVALDEYIVSIFFADDITQELWPKELGGVC